MTKDLDKSRPILLDCDGVIAGFNQLVTQIAREKGYNVTIDDCKGDTRQYDWWTGAGLEEAWTKQGFCSEIPILPGSQEFVQRLREMGFRVVFLTSPPKDNPTWPHERRLWLEKNFDARRVDVIFAVDKRYVDGMCFIDDHVKNILHWQEYQNKRGILMKQPWNEDILKDCDLVNSNLVHDLVFDAQLLLHKKKNMNIVRTNNWNAILQIVELVKYVEFFSGSQTKKSAS